MSKFSLWLTYSTYKNAKKKTTTKKNINVCQLQKNSTAHFSHGIMLLRVDTYGIYSFSCTQCKCLTCVASSYSCGRSMYRNGEVLKMHSLCMCSDWYWIVWNLIEKWFHVTAISSCLCLSNALCSTFSQSV